MTWTLYRWVWQVETPLFIGMPPAGALNRCRMYVPARPVWGALTAEVARLHKANTGFPKYLEVGSFLKENSRLSYLYPAEKVVGDYRVWLPEFQEKDSLVWRSETGPALDNSPCPDRFFRNRLLDTRPSTAIEPSSDAAFEGSLRETECIQPSWKNQNGEASSRVYLVGYLMTSKRRPVFSQIKEVERLFIGGDTRYGLGSLRRVAIDNSEGMFGARVISDGQEPLIKTRHLLSHGSMQLPVQMRGALESVAGWDNTNNHRLQSFEGGPLWVPGTVVKAKDERSYWSIGHDGFWTLTEQI